MSSGAEEYGGSPRARLGGSGPRPTDLRVHDVDAGLVRRARVIHSAQGDGPITRRADDDDDRARGWPSGPGRRPVRRRDHLRPVRLLRPPARRGTGGRAGPLRRPGGRPLRGHQRRPVRSRRLLFLPWRRDPGPRSRGALAPAEPPGRGGPAGPQPGAPADDPGRGQAGRRRSPRELHRLRGGVGHRSPAAGHLRRRRAVRDALPAEGLPRRRRHHRGGARGGPALCQPRVQRVRSPQPDPSRRRSRSRADLGVGGRPLPAGDAGPRRARAPPSGRRWTPGTSSPTRRSG